MTKENAVAVLQKMITRIEEKKVGGKTYQTYYQGMIDVCNISKQIEMSSKLIEDTIFSDTYNCPACGAFLTDSNYKEFVQEDLCFCPACGQKLNWSEKNDDARDEALPAEAEKERDDYIEACTMAIEALEKQRPKKPIDVYNRTAWCPDCGELLVDTDYCSKCGPKIDWGGENDG